MRDHLGITSFFKQMWPVGMIVSSQHQCLQWHTPTPVAAEGSPQLSVVIHWLLLRPNTFEWISFPIIYCGVLCFPCWNSHTGAFRSGDKVKLSWPAKVIMQFTCILKFPLKAKTFLSSVYMIGCGNWASLYEGWLMTGGGGSSQTLERMDFTFFPSAACLQFSLSAP